jgi:hypothetical protein
MTAQSWRQTRRAAEGLQGLGGDFRGGGVGVGWGGRAGANHPAYVWHAGGDVALCFDTNTWP